MKVLNKYLYLVVLGTAGKFDPGSVLGQHDSGSTKYHHLSVIADSVPDAEALAHATRAQYPKLETLEVRNLGTITIPVA